MTKPLAYLKEWEVDGEKRCRVDLHSDCEPWLRAYGPRITSLYARSDALEPGVGLRLIRHMLPMLQHKIVPIGEGHVVIDNRSPEDVVFTVDVATLKSGAGGHAKNCSSRYPYLSEADPDQGKCDCGLNGKSSAVANVHCNSCGVDYVAAQSHVCPATSWNIASNSKKNDMAADAGLIRPSSFDRDLPCWHELPQEWKDKLTAARTGCGA